MSLGTIIYLFALVAIFVAQRLLGGHDPWQAVVTVAGVLGLGVAMGLRFRSLATARDRGLREGHRLALAALVGGVVSLLIYALVTDTTISALALSESAEKRWVGSWSSLWPIITLASASTLVVVDRALVRSPELIPVGRVREAAAHGLAAALGVALLFPLNYAASRHNVQWDLRYFKTTLAGTATHALVDALEKPVTVRVFAPTSSDLVPELHTYFDALEGPNLVVEYLDYAAEPKLSKALSVRENGIIALTVGELDLDAPTDAPPQPPETDTDPDASTKPVTRTIRLGGEDVDKAQRKLKKLDEEVQKVLRELGQGERIAYVTEGHGELDWSGQAAPDRKIRGLKQIMEYLGFTLRKLKASSGLADEIPDDADLLLVLGPETAFLQNEADTIVRFLERGKAVLIALDPASARGPSPLQSEDALLGMMAERLGVSVAPGVLASEQYNVPRDRDIRDRLNILTDRYTTHGSTATLSKIGGPLVFLEAGRLETTPVEGVQTTATVRSLPTTWADLDGDIKFSSDNNEVKQSYNLAIASTGGDEAQSFRALVIGDSGVLSDLVIQNPQNQQFVADAANWLIGAEALSGQVESEEDVRIEHTREEQALWFYAMVLGIPALIVGAGALHVRRRRRVGGKTA